MNKKRIFAVIFVIWISLWLNFVFRDLIRKGRYDDYKELIGKDEIARYTHTYGEAYFEFLVFCKRSLPKDATYSLAGIEELSLDYRRAVYYLYPNILRENADYLLVFGLSDYSKSGYRMYKMLDNTRFILYRIT